MDAPPRQYQMESEALTRRIIQAHQSRDSSRLWALELVVRQMALDPAQPTETRALGRVLLKIVLGDRTPSLVDLSEDAVQVVEDLLDAIKAHH